MYSQYLQPALVNQRVSWGKQQGLTRNERFPLIRNQCIGRTDTGRPQQVSSAFQEVQDLQTTHGQCRIEVGHDQPDFFLRLVVQGPQRFCREPSKCDVYGRAGRVWLNRERMREGLEKVQPMRSLVLEETGDRSPHQQSALRELRTLTSTNGQSKRREGHSCILHHA